MIKKAIIATPHELTIIKQKVYKRDLGLCRICELPVNRQYASYHHIIPRGRLHLDVAENLATVHHGCHMDLHSGAIGITVDDFIEMHKLQIGVFYDYRA